MRSPLLAALSGRCPACREGRLYENFLMLHELCPSCGVRFERYVGTRIIATVLSFAVGAAFAFGARSVILQLEGAPLLVPLAVALAAVTYPIFRNVAVWILWSNGLVTVDEPEPPRRPPPPEPPLPEPFAAVLRPIVALPADEEGTTVESRLPGDEEPTEGS